MKIVAVIAQVFLGLIFFVFGLNGFFQFIHAPLPGGLAGEFLDVLIRSHYVLFVSTVQVVAGALLLINRFVPLAIALLAPVLANILVYHATMQRAGLPLAIIIAILWIILFYWFRGYFAPIFSLKTRRGNEAATSSPTID